MNQRVLQGYKDNAECGTFLFTFAYKFAIFKDRRVTYQACPYCWDFSYWIVRFVQQAS